MRTLLKLNACLLGNNPCILGLENKSLVWRTNPWSGKQPLVWKTTLGLENNPLSGRQSGRQSLVWKNKPQTSGVGWVVHWVFKGQVLDLRNPDSSVRGLRFVFQTKDCPPDQKLPSRPGVVFQTQGGCFSRPRIVFQTKNPNQK